MASYSDQAIILKRTDFDEAKRIITLLTKNHGKISAVAPGVRKVTSRKASHLELFNHARVFLVKGKNLDLVTEAEAIDSFENIRSDLEKIGTAYYLVELVDALIPEEQRNAQVFNMALTVLKKLNGLETEQSDNQVCLRRQAIKQSLRDFEIDLLKNLGFWSDEIHGRNYPADPKAQARFNQLLIEQIIERELKSAKFLCNH